jgi:hypothetical protein
MPLDGVGWRGSGARPWAKRDDTDLLEGRTLGFTFGDLAILLGRPSCHTVAKRYRALQLRAADNAEEARIAAAATIRTKTRTCLCCGRGFMSSGPGNRRCLPCADAADDIDTACWL